MTTVKLSKNLQNPRGVYSIPVTLFMKMENSIWIH